MGGPGQAFRSSTPNGPQLASLKPWPDGRVWASFWVGPGLAYPAIADHFEWARTTGAEPSSSKLEALKTGIAHSRSVIDIAGERWAPATSFKSASKSNVIHLRGWQVTVGGEPLWGWELLGHGLDAFGGWRGRAPCLVEGTILHTPQLSSTCALEPLRWRGYAQASTQRGWLVTRGAPFPCLPAFGFRRRHTSESQLACSAALVAGENNSRTQIDVCVIIVNPLR